MARAPAAQQAEELPEADRLEGFPHPRQTRTLHGHDAAVRELETAFAGGRMHHAWLIAGRPGIGKATLAYRFARYVLSDPQDREARGLGSVEESAASRQVRALSHPGLLVLRRPYDVRAKRFASSILIDEVRKLRTFLGLTGAERGWRVVIVDTADELNINAANALLKSLEEPPARAVFLLLSSEPGGLLATIRSRCRRLDLAPLDGQALRQATAAALAAAGHDMPPAQEWDALARLAEGSVRRALSLIGSDGLELQQKIERIFAQLPRVDWTAMHTLSDGFAFGAQEQRFEAFFELFLERMARLVRARATGTASPEELALAERLIPDGRLASWAALWETTLREKADADELNLDRKALVLRALAGVEALAGRRSQD